MQSEPELTQYRAVSPWAVATLLAGLAAPLALVGPLLWWAPLVAIPLAVLAFRQLAQADPQYVGKTAAIAGLCSAALFFAWAVTQRMSREVRLAAEAHELADGWLQLVLENKLQAAHQLQIPTSRRVEPSADLRAYYEANPDPQRDFNSFRRGPAVAALAGQKGQIELAFAEVVRHLVDGTTDYVVVRYEVTSGTVPGSDGSVWVTVQRELPSGAKNSEWQIASLSLVEPASASH